ncbi:hypothetical protein C8R44DRAFT_768985, partial [Mycena epipterygia]
MSSNPPSAVSESKNSEEPTVKLDDATGSSDLFNEVQTVLTRYPRLRCTLSFSQLWSCPPRPLSTDLHVSFVSSAREGDTLWVEGIAERVGGTLAFARVRVGKEVGNRVERALVATGSHTKYV